MSCIVILSSRRCRLWFRLHGSESESRRTRANPRPVCLPNDGWAPSTMSGLDSFPGVGAAPRGHGEPPDSRGLPGRRRWGSAGRRKNWRIGLASRIHRYGVGDSSPAAPAHGPRRDFAAATPNDRGPRPRVSPPHWSSTRPRPSTSKEIHLMHATDGSPACSVVPDDGPAGRPARAARFRPTIQALESRTVLSVTAVFNPGLGTLTVVGDVADNTIEITRDTRAHPRQRGGPARRRALQRRQHALDRRVRPGRQRHDPAGRD